MLHRKSEIFVKYGPKTTKYDVNPSTTVRDLKEKIAKDEKQTVDSLDLVWGGRKLGDDATLAESSLQDGTSVQLILHVTEQDKPAAAKNKGDKPTAAKNEG